VERLDVGRGQLRDLGVPEVRSDALGRPGPLDAGPIGLLGAGPLAVEGLLDKAVAEVTDVGMVRACSSWASGPSPNRARARMSFAAARAAVTPHLRASPIVKRRSRPATTYRTI
jgi:hypothetical protein